MSHKIIKCKHCGTVIMQCRCPSKEKDVELSDCGCRDEDTYEGLEPKDL